MKGKEEVISEFNKHVNMTAEELESWLKSGDSNSAGWPKDDAEGDGETVGHDSGRKIVEILKANPEKKEDEYTDEQVEHMRKVVAYCKRHLAQESKTNSEKSPEEVKETKSYASLKNWGHDFLKAQGKDDKGDAEKEKPSKSEKGDDKKAESNGSKKQENGSKKKGEDKEEEKEKADEEPEKAAAEEKAEEKADDDKEEEQEASKDDSEEKTGDKRKTDAEENGSNKKRQTRQGEGKATKKSDEQEEEAAEEKGAETEEKEAEAEEKETAAEETEEKADEEMKDGDEKGDDKENGDDKKTKKGPEKGDTVSWNWGNGNPEGKVLDVKEEKTTIETKNGNEVSRDGNPDDPAVVLDTGKSKAIKSNHELN